MKRGLNRSHLQVPLYIIPGVDQVIGPARIVLNHSDMIYNRLVEMFESSIDNATIIVRPGKRGTPVMASRALDVKQHLRISHLSRENKFF